MNTFKTCLCKLIFKMAITLSFLLYISCDGSSDRIVPETNDQLIRDSVVSLNHQIVKTEIQEIDDFIQRYHWEMKKTPSGLRYMIYKNGDGNDVKPGDIVAIKYKINLLNGDLVGRSDSIAPFTVEIGRRAVVSGLEEGILLMKPGSHAKLILPSHLAYGLLCDKANIPARAVLVYDVELCAINQPKK